MDISLILIILGVLVIQVDYSLYKISGQLREMQEVLVRILKPAGHDSLADQLIAPLEQIDKTLERIRIKSN